MAESAEEREERRIKEIEEQRDRLNAKLAAIRARRAARERKERTRRLIQVGAIVENALNMQFDSDRLRGELSQALAMAPWEGQPTNAQRLADTVRDMESRSVNATTDQQDESVDW